MKQPSEKLLAQAERELRRLGRDAQRAVGGGVYMRLDRSDERKRRFTYRGVAGRPGGTADTWREAYDAREALKRAGAVPDIDPLLMSRAQQRLLSFETYTLGVYRPDAVLGGLEISTRADYFPRLERDVFPVIGHFTLAELEEKPSIATQLKEQLAKRKRFPEGHRRAGELPEAACNAAIKVASSVCDHAWGKDVIGRNPFRGINRFNRRRTPGGQGGGSYRRVELADLMEPAVMAAVGVGMRGDPVQLLQRRLKPLLIVIGMRPQVIDGAPWRAFRDEHGPTRYITVSDAVKDIAGHLMLGQPKTGTHTLYQFDSIARLLDTLYDLQGRPSLHQIALPNTRGRLQDHGNWRDQVWYPALHRAGFTASPHPTAQGAFDPYTLRHVGATTMLSAARHDGASGGYSRAEVARQFGHSPGTLDRVYHHVLNDPYKAAGKTMDEIIAAALREVWGAMPGDPDFQEILLTTNHAAELTGLSVNQLGGRISRGRLPAQKTSSRYLVSEFDLAWSGLLHPGARTSQPGLPAAAYSSLTRRDRPDL